MLCGLALFCGLALLRLMPARAASSPESAGRLDVRLGFGGIVKIGVPLPLEVVLPPLPGSGHAELVVEAPALGPEVGRVVTTTAVPFQAVAGATRVIRAPVAISDPRRPLEIRVIVNGQQVLRTAVTISPDQVSDRMVVALSDERAGLAALHRLPGRVAVAYVTPEALPRLWQEYAAVDLLVIHALHPAALDDAQQEALLRWVRFGGHLLLIARSPTPLPVFLDPILPATVGEARTIPSPEVLAARYGGALPPGPLTVTTLLPHPGAGQVVAGGLPVIVSGDSGDGRVTIWGFDPWQPPLLAWSGRLRLWEEALGRESAPRVDPEALAERLPAGTPLDPGVHAEVGGAILFYLALLLGLLRWKPTMTGAAGALLVVLVGLVMFPAIAEMMRNRSATLAQVTIIGPVVGRGGARATTVAAVAVPYGGRYQVTVAAGMVAGPVTPVSNLRIELGRTGTVLTGALRSGEPPRPFQAVGGFPLAASAAISQDGRSLAVDLGSVRARHVELRWRDRIYPLGDLPAGRTGRELHPDGWIAAASDARSSSELSARVRDGIFQGPMADAILKGAAPVLVGDLEGATPVFTLRGVGAPGQRLTILLVPLERR